MTFNAILKRALLPLLTGVALTGAALPAAQEPVVASGSAAPAENTASASVGNASAMGKAASAVNPTSKASDGYAGKRADEYFVSAPTIVFPSVDSITRLDMIDYFQAGSQKASKNLFGGDVRILSDEPTRLTFSTSAVTEYTIDLLPASGVRDGVIIMVTRTLQMPAADSSVRFYTTDWKELKGMFEVPQLHEWLTEEGRKNRKDVENMVPYIFARITYLPESREITVTNNLDDYIPEENLEKAKAALEKTLRYKWNGKKLVRVKN